MKLPKYLRSFADEANLEESNPREINRKWFDEAGYGLFLHYGLYSLLGRHEWVMFREKIRVKEYEKLKDDFTAENFDAGHIASLAKDSGMKYINITTRHHDSFCLWNTKYSDFNSVNSPAGRDLVAELATACEKQELGLFLYYSHGRDWHHPHAPNKDRWDWSARPDYDPREPSYKYGEEHDLGIYLEFMKNQIIELLTLFPTVAGIWLDGISTPMSGDYTLFKCQELYDAIRATSPHALISYKQGLLGTEDFFAPENRIPGANQAERSRGKIYAEPGKKVEVCSTIVEGSWGYFKGKKHKDLKDLIQLHRDTRGRGANLLLNTGPLPDGSIDPEAIVLLKQFWEEIKDDPFLFSDIYIFEEGMMVLDDDDVACLKMTLTPENPMLFDVTLGEILEPILDGPVTIKIDDKILDGHLCSREGDKVVFKKEPTGEAVPIESFIPSGMYNQEVRIKARAGIPDPLRESHQESRSLDLPHVEISSRKKL